MEHSAPFHLVCWNVAGWTSTAQLARTLYNGSVAAFLDRFKAEVICLQEAKVKRPKLTEDPQECGAADKGNELPGWESFWACSEQKHRGMNGVVTFAKAGLVHRADAAPLQDAELDGEGRCVAVYLSAAVVFNVYVPNSRGGERQEHKSHYLRSLRAAMARVRAESGLPVVLVGDLNTTYRPEDCHWSFRRIHPHRLALSMAECPPCITPVELASMQRTVASHILTGDRFQQPKAHDIGNRTLSTGSAKGGELMPLDECMATLRGVGEEETGLIWVDSFTSGDPHHAGNRKWYRALRGVEGLARPSHTEHDGAFMRDALFGEDGMVDSLLAVRPGTRARPTCFNQLNNSRYYNYGSRIDYILVDPALAPALRRGDCDLFGTSGTLDNAGLPNPITPSSQQEQGRTRSDLGTPTEPTETEPEDLMDEYLGGSVYTAGLRASTCYNLFHPAPFDGTGLAPLEHRLCEVPFLATPPHTGILYTAPQLSDHLAVTALLDLRLLPRDPNAKLDSTTLQCMFRPLVRSVLSFFKAASKKNEDTPVTTAPAPTKAAAPLKAQPKSAPPVQAPVAAKATPTAKPPVSDNVLGMLKAARAKQALPKRPRDEEIVISDSE